MLLLDVTEVGVFGIAIFAMAGLLLASRASIAVLARLKLIRPRFSLRFFLVATTLLAIVVAWLSTVVDRVYREERIVAQIFVERGAVSTETNDLANWMYRKFGMTGGLVFGRIDTVILQKTVNESMLERLVDLRFRSLSLNFSPIHDSDLQKVGKLRQLESLTLQNTSISDDGLKHLANLDNLQKLDLWGTPIDGSGLRHLARLSSLRKLILNRTLISDEAVDELKQLKSLRILSLSGTAISDESIEDLKRALPNCNVRR